MKNGRKVGAILVCLAMITVFGAGAAIADSSAITTVWIVPGDYTFTASYPTVSGQITFDVANEGGGQNFTDIRAKNQTESIAGLRITSNANAAIAINGSWQSDWPAGVKYVNVSVNTNANDTTLTFSDSTETSSQVWNSSIGTGTYCDFWLWTTGVEVAETSGISRTLNLYSQAA